MNVFLLCGSSAEKSHTSTLLQFIAASFEEQEAQTTLWDLRSNPLPFALAEFHKDPTLNPDPTVRKFIAAVDAADVIILGAPLYHGSYSGVLKNALDHLRGDALQNKWVGLVGNASGVRAGHLQFSHLRQVVNTLYGYCAQTQVGTCRDDYVTTPEGLVLRNDDMKDRCNRLVSECLKLKEK